MLITYTCNHRPAPNVEAQNIIGAERLAFYMKVPNYVEPDASRIYG